MPTKKKHSKKSHKQQHRRRQNRSYFKGGVCSSCGSCMQQPQALLNGGRKLSYKSRRGGNDELPSYNGLPLRYVYGQNQYNGDPTSPNAVVNTRLLSGGKTRRNNSKKGGSMGFSYLNGQLGSVSGFNPVSIVGESSGAALPSNIISGAVSSNTLQNPSVFSQPVDDKYNIYNRPIA